ncbi:MAG TPA: transcription antitermination factor NusB, partial [Microbacteriaceae bacterium]
MSARTKARKRAVDALFAGNLRNKSAEELLEATFKQNSERQNQEEIFDYARSLVNGFAEHQSAIDSKIELNSQGWRLDRMSNLDLSILRVACFEILYNDEIPDAVAISEAKNLAEE